MFLWHGVCRDRDEFCLLCESHREGLCADESEYEGQENQSNEKVISLNVPLSQCEPLERDGVLLPLLTGWNVFTRWQRGVLVDTVDSNDDNNMDYKDLSAQENIAQF